MDSKLAQPESSTDEAGSDSRTDTEPPLLREVYPELCAELVGLLTVEGLSDLGDCAHDLRIVAPCRCGDDFCQSFYTAPLTR